MQIHPWDWLRFVIGVCFLISHLFENLQDIQPLRYTYHNHYVASSVSDLVTSFRSPPLSYPNWFYMQMGEVLISENLLQYRRYAQPWLFATTHFREYGMPIQDWKFSFADFSSLIKSHEKRLFRCRSPETKV